MVPRPCCNANGNCQDAVDPVQCTANFGVAVDELNCGDVLCEDFLGSCCHPLSLPGFPCFETTAVACAHGGRTFLGNGTNCAENPCPTPIPGTCCLTDPAEFCLDDIPFCELGGGTRVEERCAAFPCQFETVACCAENGDCFDTTEAFCTENDGLSLGPGSACETTLCPGEPTWTPTSTPTVTPTQTPAPGECPPTIDGSCLTGFKKGFLLVKEKQSGKEKLVAKLISGPALEQTDMGNPLVPDGTIFSLCIYDNAGMLAGRIIVDRAGEECDGKPCWKKVGKEPPDGKGYKYKDKTATSDGVKKIIYKGGEQDKSKAVVIGKGGAIPAGIPAALQSSANVTLQLRASDGQCLSVTVGDVKKNDPDFFKAK